MLFVHKRKLIIFPCFAFAMCAGLFTSNYKVTQISKKNTPIVCFSTEKRNYAEGCDCFAFATVLTIGVVAA
jgi:hypothetical protein